MGSGSSGGKNDKSPKVTTVRRVGGGGEREGGVKGEEEGGERGVEKRGEGVEEGRGFESGVSRR